nr:YqzE family protein [Oceanobacillus polygoni]
MMSGNDYLKFMTEQVVSYLDLPSEERKKRKEAHKQQDSFYATRWLGMLPFTLKIMFQKENSR